MPIELDYSPTYIEISGLLGSPELVGMYRGKETLGELQKKIEKLSSSALMVIDIRKANPLQYEFCEYAFGPLLETLKAHKWGQKSLIFRMYDYHKPGFFRGVLKHLGTELPRKESEKGFVGAGFYIKLIIGDEVNIEFIGNLNDSQKKILDLANEMNEVTTRQVVEKLGFSEEIAVQVLQFLVQNDLVLSSSDQTRLPHYYSFYKYFRKGA